MLASWSNCYAFFKDLEIWEQGNQYIELVPWDVSRSARNDHPIEIDIKLLSIALQYLKANDKNNNKLRSIFSKTQSDQLAMHINDGLNRANIKLDLVFVVNDEIENGRFITGRVFYIDGRLNLIFGERNGKPGLRARSASDFFHIIENHGIQFNSERKDWLILHYEQIANNIEIETLKAAASQNTLSIDIPSQKESETVQRPSTVKKSEVRELRLENARLKKKLLEQQKNNSASKITLEERLKKLQNLYDKKLITTEEYDAKRVAILEEL